MLHSSLVDGKDVVGDTVKCEENNSDGVHKDHSVFIYENSIA